MSRAVIISNGEYNNYDFYRNMLKKDDFIICTDGAIKHCEKMNCVPDVWIGDFDSSKFLSDKPETLDLPKTKIIRLNPIKDETDTHSACDIALKLGYKELIIWGALGLRADHMMANIAMLEYINEHGAYGYAENEKNRISFVNKYIKIKKEKKYLSIVPLDSVITIDKTTGLLYALENEELFRSVSRGISNEFTSDYAEVFISSGGALIIESND